MGTPRLENKKRTENRWAKQDAEIRKEHEKILVNWKQNIYDVTVERVVDARIKLEKIVEALEKENKSPKVFAMEQDKNRKVIAYTNEMIARFGYFLEVIEDEMDPGLRQNKDVWGNRK